ncbi:Fis family transcriptional regulator [Myxococcus stipitatus DSM 14675]|uniref:Fis family transcriptional regulator n=1 Tax=Myxococcus stipitatus (strain DSM 14675 / JCM 12634 / Mx s8) TaxID=1278073 RepID=L7UDE7_MYXSD|nr:sigma-54-dependent Fis family transcriptional regulator [Myxococcus stipitatus]AGC45895.1 Fis family transcriptional regulator [Myxococcus stipitatus DSM 14675]
MPALLLLTGPSAGLRYEVLSDMAIGRSPSCEIPLRDDQVSRKHAQLTVSEGQVRLADLDSRNGTLVNGARISNEVVLYPGDRVLVGSTMAVFEPPPVTLVEGGPTSPGHVPIEEVLPHVGAAAALYSAGTALLGATSEAMVLRRLADEVARALSADRAAALLGTNTGLLTAAVSGAEAMAVPRSLAQVALERKELVQAESEMCAPLVASGGMPFGVLYATRADSAFTGGEGQLLAALGRLGGRRTRRCARGWSRRTSPVLLGASRVMRALGEAARRAANSAAPVVLHGEPGTGKTQLARVIHARSPRALEPLVVVDCRQPADAVEEALFGRASAPGRPPVASALLRADQGSLLLQHVDALSRGAAERLARLMARRVAPARQGGEEPVDVRLLVTSVAPVALQGTRGEVEASLARALMGFELEVPPLRDRRQDVLVLLERFVARAARRVRREPPTLGPEAKRLLADYSWPQNVRELELVAERLGLLYAGGRVGALHLPPEVQQGSTAIDAQTLQARVGRLERDAIAEALRESGGKKVRAAALLGISRPTLDKKIGEYGLAVARGRRGEEGR